MFSPKANDKCKFDEKLEKKFPVCCFCKERTHSKLYRCPKFKSLNKYDRHDFAYKSFLCYGCLGEVYSSKNCKDETISKPINYKVNHCDLLCLCSKNVNSYHFKSKGTISGAVNGVECCSMCLQLYL